ncbi:MAG: SDR family NAD(P)-dependent oxidoreductase [Candidatus Promineifilaceae bacterium]
MEESSPPAARPLQPQPKAIVVGASSGIGAAVVEELAGRGYQVAAVARREAELAALCERVNSRTSDGGLARYYPHDVTSFEATAGLFQQITGDLGGLDALIYTAGLQTAMSENEYNFEKDAAMVEVNLLGAMAWLGLAAARFERARAGQIVAVSSVAGDRGRRLNPGYNSSKAGLTTYLEGLRNRLSRHGVTVTTIKPGFVDTALLAHAPKTMWVISAREAAVQIGRAMQRRKQTVYVPARWRLVMLVIRHIPSVIFRRLSI